MRKITVILLAFLMVLELCIPVSAADTIDFSGIDFAASEPAGLTTSDNNVQLWAMHSVGYAANFKYPATELTVEYRTGTGYKGIVEVRLDGRNGELIGSFDSNNISGEWTNTFYTISLTKPVTGKHTIWLYNVSGMHWICSVSFNQADPDAPVRKFADLSDRFAFTDIAEDVNATEISLLADLGIVSTDNAFFMPDRPLRRIDFVHMLGRSIDAAKYASGDELFSDIDKDSEDGTLLSGLYNLGIIKGYDDGTFKPNNIIKLNEAASVCVNALGYSVIQNTNAFEVVNNLKLFKGIDTKDDYLNKSDGARLIYNILISDYLVGKEIINDYVAYEPEKNFLEKNTQFIYAKGKVTGNFDTDLYAPHKNRNTVTIDGIDFVAGSSGAASLLGITCEYFYTEENGIKKIAAIRPVRNAQIETYVTGPDYTFKKISEQEIVIYDDEEEYEFEFDSKTAFIYNGVALDTTLSSLIDINRFMGKVSLVDNDRNGIYDCVWIDHAKSIVVGGVRDGIIKDDISGDVIDTNNKTFDLFDGSMVAKASSLATGNLLTVYESVNRTGTKLVRALISKKTVSGTVSAKENRKVTIDGEEFIIDFVCDKVVSVGLAADFMLNEYMQIVTYNQIGEVSSQVGVFLAAHKDVGAIDNKVQLKLLTKDGIKVFDLADRVLADAVVIKDAQVLYNGNNIFAGLKNLTEKSIVLYKLDSNEKVKFIDSEKPGAGGEDDALKKLGDSFTTYGVHSVLLDIGTWRTVQPFTPDATFITVTADNDERNFKIQTGFPHLSDQNTVRVTPYTSKTDSFIADILYANGYSVKESDSWQYPFAFKAIEEKINADGDKALFVTGTCFTGKVSYEINMEKYAVDRELQTVVQNLKAGDIVWPKVQYSKVERLELTYTRDGSSRGGISPTVVSPEFSSPPNKGGPGLSRCRVEKIENGFVKLRFDSDVAAGNDLYRYYNMSQLTVATLEGNLQSGYKAWGGKPSTSIFEGDEILGYFANYTIYGAFIYRDSSQ